MVRCLFLGKLDFSGESPGITVNFGFKLLDLKFVLVNHAWSELSFEATLGVFPCLAGVFFLIFC